MFIHSVYGLYTENVFSSCGIISPLNILNDTSLINITAGIYHITVSDINGCSSSSFVELTEPDVLTNYFTTDSITCFGGSNGSAYANVSGGTMPYSYSWSITGSDSSSTHNLMANTDYLVSIQDTNGCPILLDTVQVLQPDQVYLTTILTTPSCYGDNDGSIIIDSISGGTGGYEYFWSNGSNLTLLSNLYGNISYSCVVVDALGCIDSSYSVFLDEPNDLITNISILSNYNGSDIQCYGDTNASILASATGGTTPYTYTWTNGQTNDLLINLGAGTYTVFVMDDNDCDDFYTIDVVSPDSISASIQTSDFNGYQISCDGLSDGAVSAIITGGYGIDLNTLLWNTGDTISFIDSLSMGSYSYIIEDINGCSSSAQTTLVGPLPISLTLYADSLICFGDSNGLVFVDSIFNGIYPFTYLWSNGESDSINTNLSSGTYSLTFLDNNNCEVSTSINIAEPDSIITTLAVTSSFNGYDISCFNASDASVSATSSGGSSPYLYSLDSNYYSNTFTYSNLSSGIFSLFIRDDNGCEARSSVLISSPDSIQANFQILANPTCIGINNGVLTSLTIGGASPYSYNWSTNTSTTNIISSLTGGMYSVDITDLNGCSISDSIFLNVTNSLTSDIISTQVLCTGAADGTANISVLGGLQPYSYLWDNGANTSNVSGLFAGIYNVIVTDANNCELTDSVVIVESDSALAFSAIINNVSCFQDLNGSISVAVIGGIGDYNYSWSNGDSTSMITNLSASLYILNVTDSAGCIVTDSFIVTQPQPLIYNLISNDISCFGLSDGNANLTVNGGTLPYTYNWTGPNNYTALSANINSLIAGSYVMIVNDSNDCDLHDLISISEPLPLMTIVSSEDPLCFNSFDGSIMINVEGGVAPYTSTYGSIIPTTILSNSIIIYQNLQSGTNILTVLDSNNCENSYIITLMNPLELSIANILTTDPSCYNYSNATASIEVLGGTLPYTYQLNDSDSNTLTGSSNNSNLSFGSYAYIVIDANGCDDTTFFNISNPNEITINSSLILDVNCYNGNTGSIEVEVDNTVGDYQIVWMPSEFNSDSELITDLIAGNYEAVVIDENGCTKLESFFVNQNDEIDIDMSVVNSSCSLSVDGQIIINNIIGGIPPYNVYNNSLLVASAIMNSVTIESLITTDNINPYNIIITDNYDCEYSSLVDVGFDGGYGCIDEPIIITPNYDGYNDSWIPILDLDTDIEVSILNRWGEKEYLYNGNSLGFSWDGSANWGKKHVLPSSDYYYIIEFTNDNYPAKTGVITLIR